MIAIWGAIRIAGLGGDLGSAHWNSISHLISRNHHHHCPCSCRHCPCRCPKKAQGTFAPYPAYSWMKGPTLGLRWLNDSEVPQNGPICSTLPWALCPDTFCFNAKQECSTAKRVKQNCFIGYCFFTTCRTVELNKTKDQLWQEFFTFWSVPIYMDPTSLIFTQTTVSQQLLEITTLCSTTWSI